MDSAPSFSHDLTKPAVFFLSIARRISMAVLSAALFIRQGVIYMDAAENHIASAISLSL